MHQCLLRGQCEWQAVIELFKAYRKLETGLWKCCNTLEIYLLAFITILGSMGSNYISYQLLNLIDYEKSVCFWKKHGFLMSLMRWCGRDPKSTFVTFIFYTLSSHRQRTQWWAASFPPWAASVFSAIKLLNGARRAWGDHQKTDFYPWDLRDMLCRAVGN